MDSILDAAAKLRDREDIHFLFVGDGIAKPGLQKRASEEHLHQVEFRDSVAPEDLVDLIHTSDVCLATTRAHPFCGETIPVKLFDYLACGRPVVAAVLGDAAAVVQASGGGVVVEPENGASLAGAIVRLAADAPWRARLSEAGPAFIADHYSRRALGVRLVAALERARVAGLGRGVESVPGGFFALAKRTVDVLTAAVLLVLLMPLLIVIGLAIRLGSPGPALFRQRRSGRGSSEFSVLKFRTMRAGTPDLASHLMGPGSGQVTSLGAFLRRTSLDELPQLWNVLKGDMSLIGPRPALHNQEDLIALRQRHGVDGLRPGVTGWAQVHGRDAIELEEKVEYDRYYRENLSPQVDLHILLRTIVVLFSSRGVY
jgi:O-antigen biosynthesis protein WbqP